VAKSVIVINARTGEVLYEKDPDARRTIASTTKLMTAMLVAESGNLNQQVEVEPIDTICEPTKLSFHPGERYARSALLYALLVHSCNDVARALARDNAGSIAAFADRMNARAAALGAVNTHFVNPNGLPSPGEDQYSTARDLARIARAAYNNAILRPIMATPHLQFQMANGQVKEFANTNKVLLRYPLCNGMKTGYTDAAGHCLVSSADDGSHAVISVCLGDNKSIWNDSQRLLMWALANAKG
jgi:D-alanyl-D-alanine carboxypeptidase (penicillin-binding protein 5/6)